MKIYAILKVYLLTVLFLDLCFYGGKKNNKYQQKFQLYFQLKQLEVICGKRRGDSSYNKQTFVRLF